MDLAVDIIHFCESLSLMRISKDTLSHPISNHSLDIPPPLPLL